jgi:hypothetical protein
MLQNGVKVFVLAVLVWAFFAISARLPGGGRGIGSARRGEGGALCVYIGGALLALWGEAEVGAIKPVSLRGMFVAVGVLLMIFAVVLANALREAAV